MGVRRVGRSLTARAGIDGSGVILGTCLACVAILAVAASLDRMSFDVMAGALTVLVLVLITVPMLRWVARKEGDLTLTRLLTWALAAKLAFVVVRYFALPTRDAGMYFLYGGAVARLYRQGDFVLTPPEGVTNPETARVILVTGIIFAVTGVSRFAGSFVFSWLCFGGQVLMWRAFRRAVPEGESRRYAQLVLFWPSLLFWPSSLGKEALMVACVGIASYGASQILGEKVMFAGIVTFIAGSAGLLFIRPHMALIAIVSLLVASMVGSVQGVRSSPSPRRALVRVAALVVLIGAASVATTQVTALFGSVGAPGEVGIEANLAKTTARTAQGGSEFTPIAVSTPTELPAGIVTVLFRPFPWEARNVASLIAASEGLLLLALAVAGRRRLLTWVRTILKRPYLVYAVTYALVFIVAFSYLGNFGILARQRVQMLPLALIALAMPLAPRKRRSWFGAPADLPTPVVEAEVLPASGAAPTPTLR